MATEKTVGEMTTDKALSLLPKAGVALVNTIYDQIVKAETNDIMSKWSIGVSINEGKANENRYGTAFITVLSKKTGQPKESLRIYAQLAEAWPDQEKFRALTESVMSNGNRLTYMHIVTLARLAPQSRTKLLRAIINKNLTVREANEYVDENLQDAKLNATRQGAGRPSKLPRNVYDGLNKTNKVLKTTLKQQEAWKSAVFDQLSELDQTLVNPKTLKALDELAVTLESAIPVLSERLEAVNKAREDVKVKLENASNEMAEVTAESEEEEQRYEIDGVTMTRSEAIAAGYDLDDAVEEEVQEEEAGEESQVTDEQMYEVDGVMMTRSQAIAAGCDPADFPDEESVEEELQEEPQEELQEELQEEELDEEELQEELEEEFLDEVVDTEESDDEVEDEDAEDDSVLEEDDDM